MICVCNKYGYLNKLLKYQWTRGYFAVKRRKNQHYKKFEFILSDCYTKRILTNLYETVNTVCSHF